MKNLNVKYFAAIREAAGKSTEKLETECVTAAELYNELKAKYNFSLCSSNVQVAVNETFKKMDYVLQANDEIVFIPPVAGG